MYNIQCNVIQAHIIKRLLLLHTLVVILQAPQSFHIPSCCFITYPFILTCVIINLYCSILCLILYGILVPKTKNERKWNNILVSYYCL